MVHTRYHFKVHASALAGALSRLGAALACPLLAEESAAREVENVHAEYRWGPGGAGRYACDAARSGPALPERLREVQREQ
jgi:secreted Zn-dependent insulinase-like peptidase